MVYLHRNGLSGILGDEMGLGKTLQTLSLVQYLKENDPKAGTGRLARPFLVVCPLSVLSSWMAEAKKWTPGLKVVRFHGPMKVTFTIGFFERIEPNVEPARNVTV